MTDVEDQEKAKRIFESDALKAMRGNMHSQRKLAIAYTHGLGVEKNYQKGYLWIKRAVNNPTGIPILHARAQSLLGWYYYQGYGTTKDYLKSLKLFQQSAKRDCLQSMSFLGHLYFNGYGVEQCFDTALFWYRKARKLGGKHENYHIGSVYEVRSFREFNKRKSLRYFQEGADQGCKYAQHRLGEMYLNGQGITKNIQQATYWLTKSSDLENDKADYCLGILYYREKQYENAIKWFLKSANKGNENAQYSLGFFNEHGLGTGVSICEAAIWYKKSATQGHLTAKKNLDKLIFRNTPKPNRSPTKKADRKTYYGEHSENSEPIINWSSLLSEQTKNYFGVNEIHTTKDKDIQSEKILTDNPC